MSFGFGLQALKKFPELLPLVAIISTAVVGCSSFMVYAMATKPDVRLIRSRGPAHDSVEPTQITKLYVTEENKSAYKAVPELEALRREIGSYKS